MKKDLYRIVYTHSAILRVEVVLDLLFSCCTGQPSNEDLLVCVLYTLLYRRRKGGREGQEEGGRANEGKKREGEKVGEERGGIMMASVTKNSQLTDFF